MKKFPLQSIVALVIVALYAVGLVLMFTSFEAGVTCWVVSTVAGAVFLFVRRERRKRAENEETIARAVTDAQKNAGRAEDDAK